MPVKDAAAMRYDTLRSEYLTGKTHHTDEFRARFFALGFVGLLPPEAPSDYIVEVYQAPSSGLWGRIDSQQQALLEAFQLLSGPATLAPPNPGVHHDERCPVRTRDAILVLTPDRLSRKHAYLILTLEEFVAKANGGEL